MLHIEKKNLYLFKLYKKSLIDLYADLSGQYIFNYLQNNTLFYTYCPAVCNSSKNFIFTRFLFQTKHLNLPYMGTICQVFLKLNSLIIIFNFLYPKNPLNQISTKIFFYYLRKIIYFILLLKKNN
jgi:hypothetical protein